MDHHSVDVLPLPIYLTADVRRLEAAALRADPGARLMERAGLAAAELARDRLLTEDRRRVLVLAGPGNNGGDGFVLARYLKQWWFRVDLLFTGAAERLSPDARAAYDAWLAAGGTLLSEPPAARADLIVDALFGIGLERDIEGRYADLIAWANRQPVPVLSLDIPSGLHADSGRVLGVAVDADHTVTFIALKPGLLTLDGPDACGEVHLRDLDLQVEALLPASGHRIGSDCLVGVLPPRRRNSHKGTFGSLGVVGGAPGMHGAALLAGRAALHTGAGRIYVGMLQEGDHGFDPQQLELMLRSAEDVVEMEQLTALVAGPGIGQSPPARSVVARTLERELPIVLDADALNLLSAHDALADTCRARRAPTVLTPHPAEAARLLGTTTGEVQHDRIAAARRLADRYRALVALKGAGTVVAAPDGAWHINTTGNPGLATAGMGDVLSGFIGALLAQGADAQSALCAAVHLHGRAADDCLRAGVGPLGLTAAEVMTSARSLLNRAICG